MEEEANELALVTSYIMYHDLLEGTKYDGSFFQKIDNVIKLAKAFIEIYPHDYAWEFRDMDWDEAIEEWVAENYEEILK